MTPPSAATRIMAPRFRAHKASDVPGPVQMALAACESDLEEFNLDQRPSGAPEPPVSSESSGELPSRGILPYRSILVSALDLLRVREAFRISLLGKSGPLSGASCC